MAPHTLLLASVLCVGAVAFLLRTEPLASADLRRVRPLGPAILVGSLAAAGVAASCALVAVLLGVSSQALPVPAPSDLPALLVFSLVGNAWEELLFRGMLLEWLATDGGLGDSDGAGFASAVMFMVCHMHLAAVTTSVGLPVLLFTLWEGFAAALVYRRYGLVGATITHGGAIFILASGLMGVL